MEVFLCPFPPEPSRAELSQGLEQSRGGALNTPEKGSAELDVAELVLEADIHTLQPRDQKRDLKTNTRVFHDCVTGE